MSAIIEFWKSAKGALSPATLRKSGNRDTGSERIGERSVRKEQPLIKKTLTEKWGMKNRTGTANGSEGGSRRAAINEPTTPTNKKLSPHSPKTSTWDSRSVSSDIIHGKNAPSSRRQSNVGAERRHESREDLRREPSSESHSSGSADYIHISDFSLQGTAGEGSFGTVFKGVWKDNGQVVALKCLKPKEDFLAIVPENELRSVYKNIYDAFKREIKFLEQAGRHPNVISLLGKSKDYQLCALEIACCDLFQLVRSARKTLPLSIAHTVAVGVLQGVSHLHEIGIIHQDIKSSNILLDEYGRAKLCDFGLAIATRGDVKVDREIITLWYRAPELLMGCATYDSRVDDWAVGCILLEMLVGGVAFPGDPAEACTCDSHRHLNFNRDQLGRIFKVVGTPQIDCKTMACHAHFSKWPTFSPCLPQLIADSCRERGSSQRLRNGPAALCAPDKASLQEWTAVVQELLCIYPEQRASCASVLQAPLFRQATPSSSRSGKSLPAPLRIPSSGSDCSHRTTSPSSASRSSPVSPSVRHLPRGSPSSRAVKEMPQSADQLLRHLRGLDDRKEQSSRLPALSLGVNMEEVGNRGLDSRSRCR